MPTRHKYMEAAPELKVYTDQLQPTPSQDGGNNKARHQFESYGCGPDDPRFTFPLFGLVSDAKLEGRVPRRRF